MQNGQATHGISDLVRTNKPVSRKALYRPNPDSFAGLTYSGLNRSLFSRMNDSSWFAKTSSRDRVWNLNGSSSQLPKSSEPLHTERASWVLRLYLEDQITLEQAAHLLASPSPKAISVMTSLRRHMLLILVTLAYLRGYRRGSRKR